MASNPATSPYVQPSAARPEAARPPARSRRGRARRVGESIAFGVSGRPAPLVALTGFLLRGGIVLLALPAVVLPSVIGLAEVTGVRAISIAGQPTWWLVEVVVAALVGTVIWLAIASVIGAVADVWLVDMAVDPSGSASRALPLPGRGLIFRLVAIRAVCAIPLVAALAWAAGRLFEATYNELTTPTDLAKPLPLRVVVAAAYSVAVVMVVWLATEAVAAIAIRRQILAGRGIWRSLADATFQVARRPLSTLVTVVFSYGTSFAATIAALFATATAFDWCRIAGRNSEPIAVRLGIGDFATTRDFRPVVFALATVALALAWAAALALSAVTAAWRSAAFTREVEDALAAQLDQVAGAADPGGLGLSGVTGERSGD